MIFAAMGTSVPFPRLLKRLDEIAAELPEEILVQTGTTPQTAKFCRMFDYAPSLEPYYEQARLVICHGGLGTPLELLRMKKPFIMIPRLAKYHEHINDHQVENSEIIARKYGIKYDVNLDELTPSLLTHYDYAPEFSDAPLEEFRKNVRKVFFP